jgi:hypothetical protein
LPIRQFGHKPPHLTHDLTWWWKHVQRPIIYCDLCTHPIKIARIFQKIEPGRIYISFFIYDWTFACITLIHSHHIHNHIPIRITIVIYNSMHIVITWNWPNYHFYHGLVKSIWFSVCKQTYIYISLWTLYVKDTLL